ncbi:hypothetical protein P261_02527 [Lachnospiraceae bacterium TWA4]|nr:hypothetical protein P261_02527 [Lachnospiraceae bacterium TWA4]
MIQERITELKSNIDGYERKIDEINEILREAAPSKKLQRRRDTIIKEIEDQEQELANNNRKMLAFFSKDAFPLLITPLLPKAKERLNEMDVADKGIKGIEAPAIHELLKRGTCLCGTDLREGTSAYKAVLERDEIKIVATFREAYVLAAVIGFVNNIKANGNTEENTRTASIFPTELSKRKSDLRLLYRIMMLSLDNPEYSIDDYMNKAFRDDADEENREELKKNMVIFNEYACGGLEYLDEKFKDLDRADDIVDAVYSFIHDFAIDVGVLQGDDLPDFEPSFD